MQLNGPKPVREEMFEFKPPPGMNNTGKPEPASS
jgi:hypothetical protein